MSIIADRVARTPAAQAGTTTAKTKKHVTPKWVDRVLLAILVMIPVLYVLGFSINKGPSMGNLGLVYKTSWGEQPIRVGQIIRFAQPNQPTWRKYVLSSIKRVTEIRKDGYFVEGDNSEHSQDSRDWGKVVPPDHVAGVVNWCWSPKRAWRALTEDGRWRNNVEFRYQPSSLHWRGDYIAIQDGERVVLYRSPAQKILEQEGHFLKWLDGFNIQLITGEPPFALRIGVDGTKERLVCRPTAVAFVGSGLRAVAFDGFAEVAVGDVVELPIRDVKTRVVGVEYRRFPVEGGMVTIAKVDHDLNPMPLYGERVRVNSQ